MSVAQYTTSKLLKYLPGPGLDQGPCPDARGGKLKQESQDQLEILKPRS